MSLFEHYPSLQVITCEAALSAVPTSPYSYIRFSTQYLTQTTQEMKIQTSAGFIHLVEPVRGLQPNQKLNHRDWIIVTVRKLEAQRWEGVAHKISEEDKVAYDQLYKELFKVSKGKQKHKLQESLQAPCYFECVDQMAGYI